ncbi:MAG: sigma-70 family RNA polymerase sigma factor [Oscillospiraceae bacterium]|nr:sigma-70 family RNA polymerase sigma factor [Oscillospiraceae bacterium]MBR3556352.1 sigma-70 family RNA polymerase sigma factor [Oscillospiraceae bacterium]
MLKDGERPLETGEQTFFQGLYQDHYRALFSYAYHLGVGREAAEDYVQEAFLTALRQAEAVKNSPNPRGYLQQVLRNVIGYQLRCMRYAAELQRKLRERIPEEGESGSGGLRPETLYRGAVSDEELRLLIRFYLEGWSQKELAEELGISLSACKKRIQRAKERLRSALEDAEGPVGGSTEGREPK